jgi:hypothetical protein
MKKKNKKPIDPIHLIPKVNTWLSITVVLLVFVCMYLGNLVISHVITNPQPTLIYRMYDNPEHNQLVQVHQSQSKLNQNDLETFVSYVMSICDLQSQGTVRLNNYRKLLALSEDTFKEKLETNKRQILSRQTKVKLLENKLQSVEFKKAPESKDIILAKVTFKQVRIMTDNTASTKEEKITLALKKVNKLHYTDSINIGGKYYGVTLFDTSFDVLAI